MNDNLFEEFKMVSKIDSKIIDKYKESLPNELISVWKSYGFGTLLNGYLKIINPVCRLEKICKRVWTNTHI